MLRFFLLVLSTMISFNSSYGFEDVDKFQARIKALEAFEQAESTKMLEKIDKKIKEVTSAQHPNLLSYDKKIQSEALKIMNEQAQKIRSESDDISISHIEAELKKYSAVKQQR